MKKEIILFKKDKLSFKYKFYILMDLLITNQVETRFESYLLFGIFYVQIISTFFSENIGVFNPQNAKSDKILNYIEIIMRLKDLFKDNYYNLRILEMIIFLLLILLIIHFIVSCLNIKRFSFYSCNKKLINYYIKIFLYILYNIICDICFSNYCFGSSQFNPNFTSIECHSKYKTPMVILSTLIIIITFSLYIIISIFYNDSFYLSSSYYAKMSCNYDIYWGINCLAISILSTQVIFLTKEIFLLYNLIMSILLFRYFINHYLYYDKEINYLTGIFHILYCWTSIFCLIFAYFTLNEKGIIYIITSIIVCLFYSNIKNRLESKIFLEKRYFKIENKFYILFYLRSLIEKINNIEESYEDKSFLSAVIQMHAIECPSQVCLTKTNEQIYLPLTNKWSDKKKKRVDDEVFLKNFIVTIMNYFILTHDCSVDMYLNLALYHLKIIGNYCQAMFCYKKATELNLSLKEYFSLIRLNIQITKVLFEKLKQSNEPCSELENLNISQYFKYEALSQHFLDEINNDVNLSLELWNSFREPLKEPNKKFDFNKIFKLTDKILITKRNIENMWNDLLGIYEGVNDFFHLYTDYIEQINDDDLKKRDLEVFRRKNDNNGDHIKINYYQILFSKETGIIIANGDKGNEGTIQLVNNEIENIFRYRPMDLKGLNLQILMPKIFSKSHSDYMEKYFKIGEKKFVDKCEFKSFGIDKNNYILKLKLAVKLFPIINENVFFISLIAKENIDDIILLDNNFIIQGMSSKLMKILNINNKCLFKDNEIPFYVICKKFVNFYNIFLKGKKKKNNNLNQNNKNVMISGDDIKNDDNDDESENDNEKEKRELIENNNDEKDDIHDNIEINENVELEYEIKLPQFLIDYSEKTNKNESKFLVQLMGNELDDEYLKEKNGDSDENELLLESEKIDILHKYNKKQLDNNNEKTSSKNNNNTPAPTPTPTPTPGGDNFTLISNASKEDQIDFNKYNEEEKLYKTKMNQYKSLFNDGKLNKLENLIDNCNKNTSSIEYKFNFTFDKYRYGNKQIAYIVRCVDNKNDAGNEDEESEVDPNPRMAKYNKEKNEYIKPLFEILEEERKEILELPSEFLKLSLENKHFQKLLEKCKNDINAMSKAYGHKKDQILEDENSSQSSQAGYDSGLLKKNRIEEIRSNLLKNISHFYTLKYIKIVILLIAILSLAFSIVYASIFSTLINNLKDSFTINLTLYESTLITSELINIFISFRILYRKYVINDYENFNFFDYYAPLNYSNLNETNMLYYNEHVKYASKLYKIIYTATGNLEMDIPNYLTEDQLRNIYWDRVDISYMNEQFYNYGYIKKPIRDLFPLALAQLLSNVISYLEDETFNSISHIASEKYNANVNRSNLYFNYICHNIIENGYDNILPNLLNKVSLIPDILSESNSHSKTGFIILLFSYSFFMIILYIVYFFLFLITSKSMTKGMEKITKIRIEKIDEIIKKIKLFGMNLKKYREKDFKNYKEFKNISEESDNQNYHDDNKLEDKKKKSTVQDSINNGGFNIDYKKFIPLTILNRLIYAPIFIIIIICSFLIPIFGMTVEMIDNLNLLLLVQNYFFGKLIMTNAMIIDIKCFMSSCKNETILDYVGLVEMSTIQEVIRGMNILPKISDYYNEKFLLNACQAAINENIDPISYNNCLKDPIIIYANNTDNLIQIIENYVVYIKKEFEMNKNENINYTEIQLFSSTHFRNIEHIFYNYICPVADIFKAMLLSEVYSYLDGQSISVKFLVITAGVLDVLYCLIFGIIIIKKLINYLTISGCIMKVIPISAILTTQELETWIENKY